MANECKAGNWLFRIDPSNNQKLQKAPVGSSSYSLTWSAPNGERILDITANGDSVNISTNRHSYVRDKHGNVNKG